MRRSKNSKERLIMHIRWKRSNHADCKTLCGEWLFDQRIRQYLGKRITVDKRVVVPKELINDICEPQLFSVHINSADQLDEPNHWKNTELSAISPYCPPIRYWDFCEKCWDSGHRGLKKLAETDL